MKTSWKRWAMVSAAALLMAAGASRSLADDKADQLAVIVGKASPLDDVPSADLQKYFKSEKNKTPDGKKVQVVMLDAGRPERDAALKGICGMSEHDYTELIVSGTFTGTVLTAPKVLPSPAAVKKFVADTPGAIGYIRASEADDTVKCLKVNGAAPGDAAYPFKMK